MERIIERVIIFLVKLHLLLILIPWLAHAQVMHELCQSSCGNIDIIFPFGIGEGCYMDKHFEVTCNHSFDPPKPFLTSKNMELLGQEYSPEGQFQVSNPVVRSGCNKTSGDMEVSFSGTPFIFSNDYNMFTAVGCNNYATLSTAGDIVGGCLSICPPTHRAANASGSGCYVLGCCQITIPPYMQSFVANITNPFPSSNNNEENDCKSAFMVDRYWFANQSSLERRLHDSMDHVPATLEWARDQGYCRINNVSNISFTNASNYYWKELNTSQVCICSCYGTGAYSLV